MRQLIIALLILSPTVCSGTTPTISNVAGTISTGQTLTLTGSNMVDLNQANWKSGTGDADSWSFEGASPENDGWLPLHRSTPDRCTYGYSTTTKLIGSKSMWMRNTGAYDGASMGECYVTDPYAEFNRSNYYGAFYFRYNQNAWPDSHQKLYLGCCDGGQIYIQPSAGDGSQAAIEGTAPTHWYVRESGGLDLVTPQPANPSGALVNDKWYFLEFHISTSRIEVWVDDAKIVDAANTGLSTNDYPGVGIPNVSGTPSNWDATINVDYFVHSNSRVYPASKIEIANSPTYATATKVYQEPIALADGTVQIKANLTGLGGGPYYIYVTNNRQEVSTAYALDGSNEDTTPPTRSAGSPTGVIAASTTSTTMSLTTNEMATCKFSTSAGTAYASMAGTFPTSDGLNHSVSVSGLSDGGSYTRYIRCADDESTPNVNTDDYTISWAVSTPGTPGSLIWGEGFDDSSLAARSWDDDYADVWVDTAQQQGGAASWRQTWNSAATNVRNSAGTDTVASIRKVIGNEDEVYIEWYWRLNSDYVGSGTTAYHPHLMIITNDLWENLSTGVLGVYLELSGQDLRAIVRRGTGTEFWYNTGYTLPLSKWVKLGAYMKMNTVGQSDGILRLYVDDAEVHEETTVAYRTSSDVYFNTLAIAPWIGDGSPQSQTMWIDELKIYDGYTESSPTTGTSIGVGTMPIGAGTTRITGQ